MIFDMGRQVAIFFLSMASGILIGVLFDIYRVIRGVEEPGTVVTAVEDILFWILTGILVFIFMMYTNYAFLSFNIFVYIGIGMVLYFALLSRIFTRMFSVFIKVILAVLRIGFYYLFYPARIIFYKILKTNNKKI